MVSKKSTSSPVLRTTALCYVRQSYTRDENDTNSPDRQKANIQAKCDQNGWIAEWYIDAEGHKSGTKEHNRPQWLALKARLPDPDVVALIANDLARMHRKLWHVGRTMDELDQFGVRLVLAAPGREVDTATAHGRMFINFIAMQDEAYAADVSQRSIDSARWRKSNNITIGIPPFGTVRNSDGYLMPSRFGAWLLPDGSYLPGADRNISPDPAAVWFGFYECAKRILELYGENVNGYNRVAKKVTKEGWMFRDRDGLPRLVNEDDVRRVTSNWREYAGLVTDGKAIQKNASQIDNPSAILRDTGRAVFDLDLLRRVAEAQEKRSFTVKRALGAETPAYEYALLQLVYCAHCERIAIEQNNPKRRSRLHGSNTDKPRYRHTQGTQCGCTSRSVAADLLEGDFFRLVNLLTLKDYLLPSMLELAQQEASDEMSDAELEKQKAAAIAKLKRQIAGARALLEDGDITPDAYRKTKEDRERQIAHWQARSTDYQKKAVELMTCMSAFGRLRDLWDTVAGEERLSLARGLFEYIVFDLDAKKIVDFRLHPWADQYLILRGEMYPPTDDPLGENKIASSSSDEATSDPIGTLHAICTLCVVRRVSRSRIRVQRCA